MHQAIDASGRVIAPGFVDIHTITTLKSCGPVGKLLTLAWGNNDSYGQLRPPVAPTRPEHRDLIMRIGKC